AGSEPEQRSAQHRRQCRLADAPFADERWRDIADRRRVEAVEQHDNETKGEHQPLVRREAMLVEECLDVDRVAAIQADLPVIGLSAPPLMDSRRIANDVTASGS